MTTSLHGTVVCPSFIGRQLDLNALQLLIDRDISGQGQVVLLSGEAGIGKSRLVSEAKTYAASHNVLILQGNCFQTDHSFPYAPFLDLFGSYFMKSAPISVTDDMKPLLSELSRLLPDVALLFPDLVSTSSASVMADPEQEKRRFFAVMTHFFTGLAAQQPILLIIEDVHWCDDLSLEFLLHLARRCPQVALLLLMTYRSDELQPRLRQWLTQLDRERLTQEFLLTRLSRVDVAAILHSILALSHKASRIVRSGEQRTYSPQLQGSLEHNLFRIC
jgi:predicted ATPase